MENEMKSCPFCGSKPSYDEEYNIVTCCGAVMPMTLNRWQTRPPQEQALSTDEKLVPISKLREFASKLQTLSPELTKIIDDNFWQLLKTKPAPSVDWEKQLHAVVQQGHRDYLECGMHGEMELCICMETVLVPFIRQLLRGEK